MLSLFSSLLAEIIQFDEYFSDGLVQPPTSFLFKSYMFCTFCISSVHVASLLFVRHVICLNTHAL